MIDFKKIIIAVLGIFYFSFFYTPIFAAENIRPTITLFPTIYYAGDEVLHLEGKSEPSSNVDIVFTSIDWEPKSFTVGSDAGGRWVFVQRLFLEKGRWEVKARNPLASSAQAVWSDPASFISVPTVFAIGSFKIKFSTLNVFIYASLASVVIIIIFAIYRFKSVQRQMNAYRLGSSETLIREKIDAMRREVTDELWHLENKLKQGGAFTVEESEHREKLLSKLKQLEDDVEGELTKNL